MFSPFRPSRAVLILLVLFSPWAGLAGLDIKPLGGGWTDARTLATLPDGSLLVAQKSGLVDRLIPEGTGFKAPIVWADLGDNGTSELLGLAVDPDFQASGYLYAALKTTVDDKAVVRLTRWRESETSVVLNRILVDNLPSGPERTGSVLKFSPDGKLWLGLGDGGAPASEVSAAKLRGVLLRFNEDGTIPADNPDPASPVWAYGFRDPGGLAWHPVSGMLYSLDRGAPVAKGTMDRLDIVAKNGNYGWPKYLARDFGKGVERAVIYCSSGHTWVPGGAVFVPWGEWKGSLLFAGAGQGYLYRLSLDPKTPTKILFYEELVGGDLGPLVDVTLGDNRQIYLLSREKVYQISP